MESRSRLLLSTAFAFAASALLISIFALDVTTAPQITKTGLFWIIILFAALNAISRLYSSERDQNTILLLRSSCSITAIYIGKLLFNFLFLIIFSFPILLCYTLLIDLSPQHWFHLLNVLILSNASLAAATTFLAMITAQTDQKASIFAVISIPILFPALLLSVELSHKSIFAFPQPIEWLDYLPLFGFFGAMLSAGLLLFESIWD